MITNLDGDSFETEQTGQTKPWGFCDWVLFFISSPLALLIVPLMVIAMDFRKGKK